MPLGRHQGRAGTCAATQVMLSGRLPARKPAPLGAAVLVVRRDVRNPPKSLLGQIRFRAGLRLNLLAHLSFDAGHASS